MALPTGPIPTVAFDEIIEETWGDSVAQSLNNLCEAQDRLLWTPDTAYLATTSTTTWANWFRVGGGSEVITVPDWAGNVTCSIQINGIQETSSGGDTYFLRVKIGDELGRAIRLTSAVNTGYFAATWTDYINPLEGDRSVWIQAMRASGSNQWSVDGSSDVAVFLTFKNANAINFYSGI